MHVKKSLMVRLLQGATTIKNNSGIQRVRSPGRTIAGLLAKVGFSFALGAAALTAPAAWAGWNSSQETLSNHPTWIYTPASTMASGKRALVIVLHGCDQSNTQIKDWGNVASTADAKGAVIALPWVGTKVWPGYAASKCWDYDGASDGSQHIAELVALTTTLADRAALNIDRNHVYITGLSAGASAALAVACKAPDLIAGVGAVAGPSLGSAQNQAISEEGSISTTSSAARDKCKILAGAAKLPYLDTQIANIGYGEKDRNAEKADCKYSAGSTSCPGTFYLVSKKWSTINADMYGLLYGTGSLGTADPVADGSGELRKGIKNGQTRLALTRIYNVGHAWPAGSGVANDVNKGGVWMAQSGMNYTNYVVGWFMENNIRKPQDPSPVMTSCAANAVSRSSITISGAATDNGAIVSYQVKLSGPTAVNEAAVGSGNSFSKSYALADGYYTGTVTATDDKNQVSSSACTIARFLVGSAPPVLPPENVAVSGTTKDSVSLKWSAAEGATGYHVYRNGSKVTTTPVANTSYTDGGLAASTTYFYTVSSVSANGESARSAPPVEGTTKNPSTCPAPVTASNYSHVLAGRAYQKLGYVYAKGSNQLMGFYNIFYWSKLAEAKPGYFIIGNCPAQ